jgi:hypothetical protein
VSGLVGDDDDAACGDIDVGEISDRGLVALRVLAAISTRVRPVVGKLPWLRSTVYPCERLVSMSAVENPPVYVVV